MANKKPKPTDSESEKIDRDLAWRATVKRRAGENPTRDELAALRRIGKLDEERSRWSHYSTIPKKHWREMSGRSNQILREQAERHGIPLDGRTIDLAAVAKWIHDFLAENAATLGKNSAKGRAADELERLRRAHALKAEIANKEKLGLLRPVDQVRELLNFIAELYRRAERALEKEYGEGVRQIIENTIAEADDLAVERYGMTWDQIELAEQERQKMDDNER